MTVFINFFLLSKGIKSNKIKVRNWAGKGSDLEEGIHMITLWINIFTMTDLLILALSFLAARAIWKKKKKNLKYTEFPVAEI